MKNKAVIFDLDGTLWSTSSQIVPAWNQVLARKGLPSVTVEQMNSFMGKTPDMIAAMMLPDMEHEKAMRVFAECCVEENTYLAAHGGLLYPGLADTLAGLGREFLLAVVSNCATDYLDIFLDYHGLRNYFDDHECYGGTGLPKSQNIRLVMERNHLASAVYVGDTELDRAAAEKAGVPFIWAAYGFGREISAAAVIHSVTELPRVVRRVL